MVTPAALISFSEFARIGFHIGKIKQAAVFPKARNPSYKLEIDFGPLGIKKSSAQLPHTYPIIEAVFNKFVVAICNFVPRNIAGFMSEVLIVGFPDHRGHVVLLNTRNRIVKEGLPLSMDNGNTRDQIPFEVFSQVDIKSATITELKQLESDPSSYIATLDVGNLGIKETVINDIDSVIAGELLNTQVPVVLNIKRECVTDPDSFVLSFMHQGKRIPFGVDDKVKNGGALF